MSETAATEAPRMITFADAEAALAARLPNYESRLPQQVGAQAVEAAINGSSSYTHLLLQAGTGVGKSYMGLIPAILSGKRTVVATATKALQSQLTQKDLPFLEENLVPFSWMMLQGRSNYFCSNRAGLIEAEEDVVRQMLDHVRDHQDDASFSGLRDQFPFEIPVAVWMKVQSESEECQELRCKDLGGCFAHRARQRARECQVVVVNHALLCADLVMNSEIDFGMLGDYNLVIADEVHELDSYAKSALGVQFTEGSIMGLTSQVRSFARNQAARFVSQIDQAEAKITNAKSMLWLAFSAMMRPPAPGKPAPSQLRLKASMFVDYEAEWTDLDRSLSEYARLLSGLPVPTESDKAAKRWRLLVKRAERTAERFRQIIVAPSDKVVSWLSTQTNYRGDSRIIIESQPIEVGEWLDTWLFSRVESFIGMSATAKVGGSFDFLARRLGLSDYDGVDVGTMFDYPNQAIFCVPRGFPEPASRTYGDWQAQVPGTILELLQASNGRALVLFTSKAQMERVFKAVAPNVPFTCLKQGNAPVPVLAQQFKEDVHSVLFATRSFMTGIDVQGEALSLVILDKLVFNSPEEPVFEAECEVVDARGGSSFKEVSMPLMQLVVEQAAGRLIRTRQDRGCFVLLDARVVTKGYGSNIRKSLPPMRFVDNLQAVRDFFGTEQEPFEDFEDDYEEEPF